MLDSHCHDENPLLPGLLMMDQRKLVHMPIFRDNATRSTSKVLHNEPYCPPLTPRSNQLLLNRQPFHWQLPRTNPNDGTQTW